MRERGRAAVAVAAAPAGRVAPRSGTRLPALDGLRGVAAVVVIVHHCLLAIPAVSSAVDAPRTAGALRWLVYSPFHLFWAGGEAVLVFFVLSGFVLARSMAGATTTRWGAYYPARLQRLYLPVAAAVVFSVLLAVLVPRTFSSGDSSALLIHDDPLTATGIARNLLLVFPPPALDSPLWSLQWEVLFSLALPLYVLMAARVRPLVVGIAGIAAIALGGVVFASSSSDEWHVAARALIYLPVFLLGAVLARNTRRSAAGRWSVAGSAALAAAAVLGLTASWDFGVAPYSPSVAWPIVPAVLGALATVALALRSVVFARFLETRAVQWLGRVSFSTYLVHEPIVDSVAMLVPRADRWLVLPLALPMSLVAAAAFFRVVEGPAHRLSQRVGQSGGSILQRRSPTRPVVVLAASLAAVVVLGVNVGSVLYDAHIGA